MATVYLALGSNIGEREKNLREAISRLDRAAIRALKTSSLYETEPVDYLDQAWFLNAVLSAQTDLPPTALLRTLREIESGMGSKKAFVKGPRLIDLDILLYDQATIDTPELQIPHPRMLERISRCSIITFPDNASSSICDTPPWLIALHRYTPGSDSVSSLPSRRLRNSIASSVEGLSRSVGRATASTA